MVFKEGRIPEEEEGQAGCEQGGKTSEQLSGQGGDEASHLNNIIAIIIMNDHHHHHDHHHHYHDHQRDT